MRTVKVRILPPQPIFSEQALSRTLLIPRYRQTCFQPALPPAVHRFDAVVAHLLKILRHQRGPESAAAIQDELCIRVRDSLLDVALDDASAQVNGAGKMSLHPFIVLANIHEEKLLPTSAAAFHAAAF